MRWSLALALCSLAACRPAFDDDPALVTSPRVLGVKSEPAEAAPGASVTFSALIAQPAADAMLDPAWSFCLAPKSIAENNVVSSACLGSVSVESVGAGAALTAPLPSNGCVLFGPNPPPGGFRPRDPDPTGGYFQPLRVDLPGADAVFHLVRLSCGLGDASAQLATAFASAYVPNRNPVLLPLAAEIAGRSLELANVPRGARVDLTAAWSAGDAESYAYFDRNAQAIEVRREAMTVSWYVSAGKLDVEASGRAENEPELTTTNHWHAPDTTSSARLWLVLRDSRGGTDFASYELTVR